MSARVELQIQFTIPIRKTMSGMLIVLVLIVIKLLLAVNDANQHNATVLNSKIEKLTKAAECASNATEASSNTTEDASDAKEDVQELLDLIVETISDKMTKNNGRACGGTDVEVIDGKIYVGGAYKCVVSISRQ